MATKYYQKNKESLSKEVRERYQNLSEEEKKQKKRHIKNINILFEKEKEEKYEYYCEQSRNLSEGRNSCWAV